MDYWFANHIHFDSRTIFMGSQFSDDDEESGVNSIMFENLFKAMLILEESSDPITIIMNNPGGDFYHGMAIIDVLQNSPCQIIIIAYGYCMSMGSIILQAADERIMAPHSIMMIHEGHSCLEGTHRDVIAAAKHQEQMSEVVLDLYLKKAKISREKLSELLKSDTYLTASEAIEYGLADRIL